MSNTRIDFIYLDEKDMIAAGVKDMERCVETMEEVFDLLGQGDYNMGGPIGDTHGLQIKFPTSSPFPNMPVDEPDRRFMSMIAYLGGRFDVCGNKWYGSNRANIEKSLPRSILMMTLTDKDTAAPLALMSANLISTMRTGAIPGVGARQLARKSADTIALIGAGVIGRTCMYSLLYAMKDAKLVKIYDLYPETAERVGQELKQSYGVNYQVCRSMEEAIREADVVNISSSGDKRPVIEPAWLKEGAYLALSSKSELSPELVRGSRIVTDNWGMYQMQMRDNPGKCRERIGQAGSYIADYVYDGVISESDITNFGDIVAGKKPGRTSDSDRILFCMGGQPVYDVAWAWDVYQNAKQKGLGVSLNLWDTPNMY